MSLEAVYKDAIDHHFKKAGKFTAVEYDILTKTKRPQQILDVVETALKENGDKHPDMKRRAETIIEPLLQRLTRFEKCIDMIAQSSPQAFGLNVAGLIWGGLKFYLVVSLLSWPTYGEFCGAI
jgi:hypothetical protein